MTTKSITFQNITAEQFEDNFDLDSPGAAIAKEAKAANEIATPVEVVEILCLANQLYASILVEHIVAELKPYGKAAEYLERRDEEDVGDFLVGIIGKDRTAEIMREVMAEVRRETKIGTGENDPATAKKRRRG